MLKHAETVTYIQMKKGDSLLLASFEVKWLERKQVLSFANWQW